MPQRNRVEQLIEYVEQGQITDAIEEFYAEDVVMQDNCNPPTIGRSANLRREADFGATIAEVHENRATSVVVDGDRAAIAWAFEFTTTDGRRLRFDQIAYQTWRGDRIAHERFYYDSASLSV